MYIKTNIKTNSSRYDLNNFFLSSSINKLINPYTSAFSPPRVLKDKGLYSFQGLRNTRPLRVLKEKSILI